MKTKRIPIFLAALMLLSSFAVCQAASPSDTETEGYPVEIHVMTEDERNAYEQQTAYTPLTRIAFLSRNNAEGTNGSICAAFTAEAENTAFILLSAPGAVDYNVQLYEGTPGEGERVSDYATTGINNGVTFTGLTEGRAYYFKISSNTLVTNGCTAFYSMIQYSGGADQPLA